MDILINGAISIITMIVGYYIGKRKQDAETSVVEAQASSTELDATEKAVAIWRNLAQDLKKEVDELRVLIDELREENMKLKEEISHLKSRIENEGV